MDQPTDATIRALKPRDRPYKRSDRDRLLIAAKSTGAKLWHFKYRIDGKEKVLSSGMDSQGGFRPGPSQNCQPAWKTGSIKYLVIERPFGARFRQILQGIADEHAFDLRKMLF